MRGWALVAVASALLLSAPTVLADHVYSHRLVVKGRLVDDAGRPLPNRSVLVGFDHFRATTRYCEGQGRSNWTTDAQGDFEWCFHYHDIPSGAGISLAVDGKRVLSDVRLDRDLRLMALFLVLPNQTGVEPARWGTQYLVQGRAWNRTQVGAYEDVPVSGLTMEHAPVDITIALADGLTFKAHTETDGYGDYSARFLLPARLSQSAHGTVTASTWNATATRPLDPIVMRSQVDVKNNDAHSDARVKDTSTSIVDAKNSPIAVNFPEPAPISGLPGATPVIGIALLVVLGASGIAGVIGVALFVRAWRAGRR